jgi:long-subunit fatty acid transport protein
MYKKLILIVLSVITIHAAKAQTEKGSQNLGASFGVSVTNSNTRNFNYYDNTTSANSKGKLTTYSIAPSYSYFIADKLDIGAAIGYSYSNQKYDPALSSQIQQKNISYSANIFLRKYFLFDNKIGIRTGPYLDYQKNKQRYDYTSNVSNYNSDSYGGGLSMDFVYYPAKNIGLAANLANLGYQHDKYTEDTLGNANSFRFNFVNAIIFSVYYVFDK